MYMLLIYDDEVVSCKTLKKNSSTATAVVLWKTPSAHVWHIATHVKDIPTKELKKRAAAMAASTEKA